MIIKTQTKKLVTFLPFPLQQLVKIPVATHRAQRTEKKPKRGTTFANQEAMTIVSVSIKIPPAKLVSG